MPNPELASAEPPRAFGLPLVIGRIRQSPADFEVTELLGFDLSGGGEHDFLYLQKVGANTRWVAGQLAAYAGVALNDVGYAGLKDRHAVTRQWFSVRRPAAAGTDWTIFNVADLSILQCGRNQRKLRRGAHAANQFRIVIRDIRGTAGDILQRLLQIRDRGVPNYFGEQRFGRNGNNLRLAESLFSGRRMKRDKRSIALSAARSCLFNDALSLRVADGSWEHAVAAEAFNLDGSGSIFQDDDVDSGIGERLAALDIHPTCVMWGRPGRDGSASLSEYDKSAAARHPDFARGLEQAGLTMARRPTRLNVRNLAWDVGSETVELNFTLARGGYATAVIRELLA